MAKLSSKHASSTHRVIVFGAPKSGKSLIAGALSEFYNMIWVDMENGYEVLFQLPQEWQERVELIKLPDTRSFPVGIETCLKIVKGPVSICEEHGKVGCMLCKREGKEFTDVNLPALDNNSIVVFDSLTQLTNSAIAHITKGQPDDYKLNYDDWGNLGKLLDIFLSHLQQASYNVIVISHETEAETEGKKKTLVPVGGTRNFSRNVAKYFDHVVYAERKNKKHVFSCSSTHATTILTGSRTGALVEDAEEGSLLPIFKPELYPAPASVVKEHSNSKVQQPQPQPQSPPVKVGGAATAAEVLARLKARK